MALRFTSKRVCASLRAPRICVVSYRSVSAASAALKGSSLPQDTIDSIAVWRYSLIIRLSMLTVLSVMPHYQLPIHTPILRRPVSSTSSYHTWSPPMCAHHRCSRRERVVTCGISRTESTSTLPPASLSTRWDTVMPALRRSLVHRYWPMTLEGPEDAN